MPSWLCKIWQFVANVLGKIIDFVLDVVKKIVGMVVEAVNAVVDGLFGGNFFLLLGAGLLAYFVLTSDKEKRPAERYQPVQGRT